MTTIEEILRNRILDITDEYKGAKREEGIQVYLGSPQQLIDELEKLVADQRIQLIQELLQWIRKESLKSARAGVLGYDFVSRLEKKLELIEGGSQNVTTLEGKE